MLTYKDINNPNFNSATYDGGYDKSNDVYYSDAPKVQDVDMLQHVTLSTLGFSVQRLKQELMGLGRLIDPVTNKPYPNSILKNSIYEAVSWAEQELDIAIRPRVVHELDDYNKTDYLNYGYIRANARPLIQVDDSRLIWNNQTVLRVPRSWFRINHRYGTFRLNPTAIFAQTSGGIIQSPTVMCFSGCFQGGYPYGNENFVPGMIGSTFVAGFLPRDEKDAGIDRYYYVPADLIAVVMKMAAIFVMEKWARAVLSPGIASESVDIDGISTGVNSTQSAQNTAASGDVRLLLQDIKPMLGTLKQYFGYNLGIIA